MTYLKLKPSQNKILLLSRGVRRNFGSTFEKKLSSAIRKKLNLGSEISKNSKVNLNLSVLRRSKQHVTRKRNSIITIGDRTCFNTTEKSRNLRLDSRISKICMQRSISRTPALQKLLLLLRCLVLTFQSLLRQIPQEHPIRSWPIL